MRLFSALLVLIFWAAPIGAQDNSDVVLPPNPTPRPNVDVSTSAAEPREQTDASVVIRPPNPTARPEREPTMIATSEVGDQSCLGDLQAAGAVFEVRGRHEGAGQCGIDDAVMLSSINGVDLQPGALLACPTALVFTNFWSGTMAREARTAFGSNPERIFVAASYACRGRNNVAGARMSEHGFGRAIDIRALALEDGQTWSVQPRSQDAEEPAARFQRAIRQAACGPFNTVLGPGSDGHHLDHIHFDNARRSSTYCR
ncbi:MAG: extensin family protein [Hyphomicrobiales bacterium]